MEHEMPECDQFVGRLRDRCLGFGLEGRPDPSRESANAFRAAQGLPPLPEKEQVPLTFMQKAKEVAQAAVDMAKTRGKLLSQPQIDARLAICQACEYLKGGRCELCGCKCNGAAGFVNKLAHPQKSCPHDPPKWGPEEPS